MRLRIGTILLVGIVLLIFVSPRPLLAQACQDEEIMVNDYKKGITELVDKIKKENLTAFKRAYHQKSCLSRLTLGADFMNIALECLDKAMQEPATTKEQKKEQKQQVQSYKEKRDGYAALKDKLVEYRDKLKAAQKPEDAKALIEKFDLSE